MNKKIVTAIIIAIILGGAGYYFVKNQSSQVPTPLPKVPQTTTQIPASSDKNVVILTDSGYSPATLTIKKGETVVFKNESNESMWTASGVHPTHTLYSGTSLSEHCPDVTNTSFDACRGYLPGASWSFTFEKVGSWEYHNHLSPSHVGTIIVQ